MRSPPGGVGSAQALDGGGDLKHRHSAHNNNVDDDVFRPTTTTTFARQKPEPEVVDSMPSVQQLRQKFACSEQSVSSDSNRLVSQRRFRPDGVLAYNRVDQKTQGHFVWFWMIDLCDVRHWPSRTVCCEAHYQRLYQKSMYAQSTEFCVLMTSHFYTQLAGWPSSKETTLLV